MHVVIRVPSWRSQSVLCTWLQQDVPHGFFFPHLQCLWAVPIHATAGAGAQIWVLPRVWPGGVSAAYRSLQPEDRTLSFLASQVGAKAMHFSYLFFVYKSFPAFPAICCHSHLHDLHLHIYYECRSEMQVPSVSVRFGLILEAYCRGNKQHLAGLKKQVQALGKFQDVSDLVKVSDLSASAL